MKSFQVAAVWICTLFILLISNKASGTPGADVISAVEFIQRETDKFQFGTEGKAIIILGNKDSGKTALIEALIGKSSTGQPGLETNIPKRHDANGTIYYEWTALDDNRGLQYQMMATRHLKKFAEKEKSAKIIFVIDQKKLKTFDVLSEIAAQADDLIPAITKYRSGRGIGVVITNVNVSEDQTQNFMMKSRIIDNLVAIKTELYNQGPNPHDKKVMEFINTMISCIPNNIQFIRSVPPKSLGVPSDLEKKDIQKMINTSVRFIPTDPAHFEYAVQHSTEKDRATFEELKAELKSTDPKPKIVPDSDSDSE